uniref:RNase H type-1 domain-containing protein n=1 Tax=Fagus sylvatica TaxID=28930 RepID=A0A2N9G1Q3_FAGSY
MATSILDATSSFSCQWCEDEPETSDHILWQCEFAQRVWSASSVNIPSGVNVNMTFTDFLECCLRELGSPEVEITMTIAWMLWVARNELKWEGVHSNVDDVCNRASVVALEFLEYGGSESVDSKMPEGRGGWSPPQLGSNKISIACHFGAASTRVGVGILIRDHEGLVVVAAGFVLQKYADQISNFAFAVFYALQLAYETGFRDSIVLEVPSRELMGLIHLDTPCLAPSGVVVEDIHAWRVFFSSIQFGFISNVCNKASYALATEAASSNLDQVWLEECPPCIIPFV